MTATLRRIPNRPSADEAYRISGSLRGLRKGNRVVRELEVRGRAETLDPLGDFEELRWLELERVGEVDLGALAATSIERLLIHGIRDSDLDPIAAMPALSSLSLSDVQACRFTRPFVLPALLGSLAVFSREDAESAWTSEFLGAIDWSSGGNLRQLELVAVEAPPVVDLSLLERLPRLEVLRVWNVRHSGSRPSPVDPPFDGLPRGLRFLHIDAWEWQKARELLQQLLPGAEVGVSRRYEAVDDAEGFDDWEIMPPVPEAPSWGVYGSLADLPAFSEFEMEHDAMQAAWAMIASVDPELAKRVDFDHESDGTGISAPSREDLESALRIIGAAE